MSTDRDNILHGDIQRAKLSAERLRYHLTERPDCWRLSIMEDGVWVYVGQLTSMRWIRAILDDQLNDQSAP